MRLMKNRKKRGYDDDDNDDGDNDGDDNGDDDGDDDAAADGVRCCVRFRALL